MVLGKLDSYMQKNETRTLPSTIHILSLSLCMVLGRVLAPYTKINSRCVKDLNVTPETINLLEENIGRTLDDINQHKILYDPRPRVREIKTK